MTLCDYNNNNNNNNYDNLYGAVTRPYRYKGASQTAIYDSYHVLRSIILCPPLTSCPLQVLPPLLSCHQKILRTSYPVSYTDPSSPIAPPNDPLNLLPPLSPLLLVHGCIMFS